MNCLNIGRCFSVLHRRSQLFIVAACEKLGLTYSEYVMLLRLFDNEGMSQDELASLLYLDKAVVTRTIKLLEAKGLTYRQKDENDKRIKHIYLTEQGKAQRDFLQGVLDFWVQCLTAEMKPEQVKAMIKGFDDLADRVCQLDVYDLARKVGGQG